MHTTDASSQPAIAPLLLFNGEGDCLGAKLRPGNVHTAEDWEEVLLPEIARGEVEERVKFRHTSRHGERNFLRCCLRNT